ncbi:MAG: hypothetical protein AAFR21_00120 [Pseudomonadota bacterium]
MKRAIRVAGLMAGAAAFLAACQTPTTGGGSLAIKDMATPAEQVAALSALSKAPVTSAAMTQADFESLTALAPSVSISVAEAVPAADGVTFKNVVLAGKADDGTDNKLRIQIDELRAWGVDEVALGAFMEGEAQTVATMADRIEATGVRVVGLESVYGPMIEASNDMSVAMVEGMAGEEVAAAAALDLSQAMDRYDVSMDRLVIDGLRLHPVTDPKTLTAESPFMAYFQQLAGLSMVVGGDLMTGEGIVVDMTMRQLISEQDKSVAFDQTMAFKIGSFGYQNFDRGDVEFASFADAGFVMDIAVPDENSGANIPMSLDYSMDYFTMSDYATTGLLEYLVRGEAPPMSATDLMSLGSWKIFGEDYQMNGASLYSSASSYVDFGKSHWLIPTEIKYGADDYTIDAEGFMDMMVSSVGAAAGQNGQSAGEAEQAVAQFEAVSQILAENGLSQIVTDYDAAVNWNPDNGQLTTSMDAAMDGVATYKDGIDAVLPSYAALQELAPAEGEPMDFASFTPLLVQTAALGGIAMELTDLGLLDKGFGATVSFAGLAAEGGDQTAAGIAAMSPEDLRGMAVGMVQLSALQAAQVAPMLGEFVPAVGAFLGDGGSLKIALDPAEGNVPLMELIGTVQSGQATPQDVLERLGASVTHTAPAE